MGLFKKLKKTFKKVSKVALPAAAAYYGGPLAAQAFGSLTNSAKSSAVRSGEIQSQDLGGVTEPGPTWSMPTNPGLLGFAGDLATAGLGLYGGLAANKASAKMAQNQMNFQREMSNTQYQRGTDDMMAAGLNPMLGYSQGGASSPGGASAGQSDVITPALTSGRQSAQMREQLEGIRLANQQTQAVTTQTNAQTGKTRAEAIAILMQPSVMRTQMDLNTSSARAHDQNVRASQDLNPATTQATRARAALDLRELEGGIISRYLPQVDNAKKLWHELNESAPAAAQAEKDWWKDKADRAGKSWREFKDDAVRRRNSQ